MKQVFGSNSLNSDTGNNLSRNCNTPGLGVEYAREGGEHETCCSTKEESTQGRQGTRQRAESDSGQIREEFFYI